MLITNDGKKIIPSELMVQLQENTLRLNVRSSKLYSQKLHLHSLIAKRDRLDYEIRKLKKRIAEDRSNGRKTRNVLREHESVYTQVFHESSVPLIESTDFEQIDAEARVAIKKFDEIDQIVEILLEMKPFSEDDIF